MLRYPDDSAAPVWGDDAERIVLGCLLRGDLVPAFLRAEHFLQPEHARLCQVVLALQEFGPVNLDGVRFVLNSTGADNDVGGLPYVEEIAGAVCSRDLDTCARIVRERWVREQLHDLMLTIGAELFTAGRFNTREIIGLIRVRLDALEADADAGAVA